MLVMASRGCSQQIQTKLHSNKTLLTAARYWALIPLAGPEVAPAIECWGIGWLPIAVLGIAMPFMVSSKACTSDMNISILVTSRFACCDSKFSSLDSHGDCTARVANYRRVNANDTFTAKRAQIFPFRDSITPVNMVSPNPHITSAISRKKPWSSHSIC